MKAEIVADTAPPSADAAAGGRAVRPGRWRWWLLVPAFAAGTVFGVTSLHWRLAPLYPVLVRAETMLPHGASTWAPSSVDRDSIEALLSLRSEADVARTRDGLAELVWGPDGRRDDVPVEVTPDVTDDAFSGIEGLERIDRLVVRMDFGLDSTVYRFVPESSARGTMIFHQGHSPEGFEASADLIAALIGSGYQVFALSMPLTGLNSRPSVRLPRYGPMRLKQHNQMQYLRPPAGHPVQYFVQPVVSVLDYIETHLPEQDVSMIGLSGGGWTTTMSAALDPRIRGSYSVAGSLPLFLISPDSAGWGEFELFDATIYDRANYLELYTMAAHGAGREHVLIYNLHDPCCYPGRVSETFAPVVESRVSGIGPGSFDVIVDDTHFGHAISAFALEEILRRVSGHAARAR